MDTKKVTKVPAAMEDLACGVGTQQQQRAGQDVEVTMIDMHIQVSSEDDLRKIDISRYTYAKIGETAYRFDTDAATGIPSDYGSGFWNISHLSTKGSARPDGKELEEYLTELDLKLVTLSESVGSTVQVFSARITKSATGWDLDEANKVVSVQQVKQTGAQESTLKIELEKNFKSLISIGRTDLDFDYRLEGDGSLSLCFLGDVSGRVSPTDNGLILDNQDLWGNVITLTHTDEYVRILTPASFSSFVGKINSKLDQGYADLSIDNSSSAYKTQVETQRADRSFTIYPMTNLNAYISYNDGESSFTVSTPNIGVTAKAGTGTQVVVDHPRVQSALAQSGDENRLAHAYVGSNDRTIVQLTDFNGAAAPSFDANYQFSLVSPDLVKCKFEEFLNYSFKFKLGGVVMPAERVNVGESFYLVGLVEA